MSTGRAHFAQPADSHTLGTCRTPTSARLRYSTLPDVPRYLLQRFVTALVPRFQASMSSIHPIPSHSSSRRKLNPAANVPRSVSVISSLFFRKFLNRRGRCDTLAVRLRLAFLRPCRTPCSRYHRNRFLCSVTSGHCPISMLLEEAMGEICTRWLRGYEMWILSTHV